VVRVNAGDVLLSEVQVGTQGQGQGMPIRVADDPGAGDPEVAVEEALGGGARGGVVVQAGALDFGAVTLRGGVVQGEQPARARVEVAAEAVEEQGGEQAGLAPAEGAQQGVAAAEVVGDAPGAEPGGGGAAAAGQEQAQEQRREELGVAFVQEGG
jgi:hypothetical protein